MSMKDTVEATGITEIIGDIMIIVGKCQNHLNQVSKSPL